MALMRAFGGSLRPDPRLSRALASSGLSERSGERMKEKIELIAALAGATLIVLGLAVWLGKLALLITGDAGWFPLVGMLILLVVAASTMQGFVRHAEKDPNRHFWANADAPQGDQPKIWRATNPSEKLQDRRVLTMSGGGYKAGLFHLGGLAALNEQGVLGKIESFSSVSGGSITAAWLAVNWSKLQWETPEEPGTASNFDALIKDPLFQFFTSQTLDAPSILAGFHPLKTASNCLAERFEKTLFANKTLADFPDPSEEGNPRFFINATDLRLNKSWCFSRHPVFGCQANGNDIGAFKKAFRIADAVAASAAFPPFFAPMRLRLPEEAVEWDWLKSLRKRSPEAAEKFRETALLGDGGIYDNLGLERAKGHRFVMVSNAGDPFGASARYQSNWYSQLRGTIRLMHRQVEQRRKLHFGDMAALQGVDLKLWEIDESIDPDVADTYRGLPPEQAWKAATFPVRLKKTDPQEAQMIIDHGASLARREFMISAGLIG